MSVRMVGTAIVVLILIFGYWYFASGNDNRIEPHVKELFEQNQKPLLDKLAATSGEQRGKVWDEVRESMSNLSDTERDQMRRLMREDGERRENDRLREFFKMSKEKQVAELDKRIDDMERMRERFANRPPSNNTNGGGNAGGGGGGGPRPDGGRGGPGGGSRFRDPQARQRFTQGYMNNSTAEERAMRSDYGARMDERRRERGLPEMGGPGGFGGGPPGGFGGPGGGGGPPRPNST